MQNKVDKQIRITCQGAATVPLNKLEPLQPESFKTLTKKNYNRLKAAILDVGFSFPELVWKSRNRFFIVDGHQRVRTIQQMLKEGHTLPGGKLPVSFTEAKNKKEASKKIAMGTSQYGEYDEESMYEFMHLAGLELSELKEWGSLPQLHMGKLEVGYFSDVDPADDEVPELPKKAITKLGDLWELGDHRLLCGDSTKAQSYNGIRADVLCSDPPYGVSYAAKNQFLNAIDKGNRIQEPILGDHQSEEDMSELWGSAFALSCGAMRDGAAYYVTGPQGADLLLLLLAMRDSGLLLKHMLIWAKNNHVLGRSDYHYKHEPIIYGWKPGAAHKFNGNPGEVSLWEINKPHASKLHPTMKPVELFARAIYNGSDEGAQVLDPFLGSGTTMIAAEKLNRRCYGIEIEPRYVDVCVERWQQVSGGKAKRIKAK